MKKMKRMFGAFGAAALALSMGSAAFGEATATPITFDPDAGGVDPSAVISVFDWSVGNAVSIGAIPAINTFAATNGAVVIPFDTLFQSALQGFTNAGGMPINFAPNLNGANAATNYELTITGKAREFVTGVSGLGPTATFGLVADNPIDPNDNFIRVYFDDSPDANPLAGTGFADGQLIFEATIDQLTSSFTRSPEQLAALDGFFVNDYPAINSVQGTGATTLEARINFADPSFFTLPPIPNATVRVTLFTTQQVLNFNQTNPSDLFFDGTNPNLGATNGLSGPDFQFQADPNQSFGFRLDIPEPATAALGLMGVAGLLFGARRRRA